jgi:hypothetical protein
METQFKESNGGFQPPFPKDARGRRQDAAVTLSRVFLNQTS